MPILDEIEKFAIQIIKSMKTADQTLPLIYESAFREAVAQADIAVSITDRQANILYVNPAFERVTGYSAVEALGRNPSILSAKTTPRALYAELWQRIGSGQSWKGRLVNRRKDGSEYLAELLIIPVSNTLGQIQNYLGIHRDVTELHRLECRVNNQKALIESVIDSAPLAIALLDGEDCVVLDNLEYQRLTAELGMTEPARLILDAVRIDLGYRLGPARDGALAFSDLEIRIDPLGGRAPRWLSCTGTWVKRLDEEADAFFGPKGNLYLLLIIKEITRQKAQHEQARLAALQALMAEENRIEALREGFLAALYQMEGPLNMLASVVTMQTRRDQHDPMTAALTSVLAAGRQALETLRQAIPDPLPEALTPVNVNALLREVLDLSTGRLLAAGVTVNWQPQAVLARVRGYPNRLRALFKALIDNAIESMNTKGWQTRELTLTTLQLVGPPNSIEVCIGDTGPGIAPDLRLKVFEPFFTTKPRHAGTGLAIAQQIVTDHGGTLAIDPGATGGCRVRVILPEQAEGETE